MNRLRKGFNMKCPYCGEEEWFSNENEMVKCGWCGKTFKSKEKVIERSDYDELNDMMDEYMEEKEK